MTKPESQHDEAWAVMLHGFIDGEIDSVHALTVEVHLSTCLHCRKEVERVRSLARTVNQEGVRWPMPDHVRAQVFDAMARETSVPFVPAAGRGGRRLVRFVRQWSFVPAMAALAASILLFMASPRVEQ